MKTNTSIDPVGSPTRLWPMSRVMIHFAGASAFVWGCMAWLEWLLVPELSPAEGGPLPVQAIIFQLGCWLITIIVPTTSVMLRNWRMLLYALPAATFVAYQV